jgi:acetylornithine/succinyldiaminopimelate/putrescine aminotransferase
MPPAPALAAWAGSEKPSVTDQDPAPLRVRRFLLSFRACWARAEVADAFRPGDHATTFGGQPLAARAALAVLDVMEREDAPARASRAGERLAKSLLTLPQVVDVRGTGLLLAAELVDPLDARAVAETCLRSGLVVNAVTAHALRFAPSLLVTEDEIDAAIAILRSVLETR